MRTITGQEVVTKVRLMSDMSGSTTWQTGDPLVSDSEILSVFTAEMADLWDTLNEKFGEDWVRFSWDYTAAANTLDQPLPADFYKLAGVDVWPSSGSSGRFRSLRPAAFAHRDRYQTPGDPRFYALRGTGSLQLMPAPSSARTYRVHYHPAAPRVTGSGDTFDGIDGWEELPIVRTAMHCVDKDGRDVAYLRQKEARLVARIDQAADERDGREPVTMEDNPWGDY